MGPDSVMCCELGHVGNVHSRVYGGKIQPHICFSDSHSQSKRSFNVCIEHSAQVNVLVQS